MGERIVARQFETPITLFGMPYIASKTLEPNEIWIVNDRGAKAIQDHEEGRLTREERDVILAEELLFGRAAFGRI